MCLPFVGYHICCFFTLFYTVAFGGESVLDADNWSVINLERSFQMEIGVGKDIFFYCKLFRIGAFFCFAQGNAVLFLTEFLDHCFNAKQYG